MKDLLKSVTGNDPVFYKIVKKHLSESSTGFHVEQELQDMSKSKDKADWAKNHPLVGLATSFKGDANVAHGAVSKNIGDMLRRATPGRINFTSALINKLIMNKDFVNLFMVNQTFKEAIVKSLIDYNASVTNVTKDSQKQQE